MDGDCTPERMVHEPCSVPGRTCWVIMVRGIQTSYQKGVAGSGKTTMGMALAEKWQAPFLDADDVHAPEALEKLRQSIPLTDEDRWPWLDRVRVEAEKLCAQSPSSSVVVACSALRRVYRDILRASSVMQVLFVYMDLDATELQQRLEHRVGHFMKVDMLASQLQTLEVPDPREETDTIVVPVMPGAYPSVIMEKIMEMYDKKK